MKLTPEQIEDRLNLISTKHNPGQAFLRDIRELVEDARGEKMFPSDKVVHGSLWKNGADTFLLVIDNGAQNTFKALYMNCHDPGYMGQESISTLPASHVKNMIYRLQEGGYSYLGQYDVAAGLPGGAK